MQVYIADADPASVAVMTDALAHIEGCQVRVFRNGLDAYLWIQNEPPDVLIVDTLTPCLGGLPMVRLLKFHQKFEHIPVIVVSRLPHDELEDAGRAVGADMWLNKPFGRALFLERFVALRPVAVTA